MIITKELFATAIEKLGLNENAWVVGLSGGADSLCLTLLTNEYAIERGINVVIPQNTLRERNQRRCAG